MRCGLPERIISIIVTIGILIIPVGCSGGHSGGSPLSTPVSDIRDSPASGAGGHFLIGYWDAYIPDSHDSMEIVPGRSNSIHLNIRKLLEEAPCTDCFKVVELVLDQVEQILTASIRITHPLPGLDAYTVFDVRVVIITDGSLYFPSMDAMIPDIASGDFTIIESDGYTRLWNTVEFGEGTGPFPILEYSKGKLAFQGEFTGTVNPYIAYGVEPRNHLGTTQALTRTLDFKLVPGKIRLGYAIDASWELPTVNPPHDIETDFPVSANALEPVITSVSIVENITEIPGSTGEIEFSLYDYQGAETVESASLECPDLWTGELIPSEIEITTPTDLYIRFEIINESGMPIGDYPALLRVKDQEEDFWLGDINHAYTLITIPVLEAINPEMTGDLVYIAPGPPSSTGEPGASNVWHLDLDTMIETQLTDFFGVGYLFHDPRINPLGTHHLHCAGPSPGYSNVRVYEFGGGNWAIPTDEVDDFADFHPDGIHIITASGEQWGNTPDLYMMEYDGSNRTKIATAPDTIRNPAVSPNGGFIAMTLGLEFVDPPSSELWLYDMDESKFTEIMAAPGIDVHPSWSPVPVDGEYLLIYESSRDHHPNYETDLYIINPFTEEIIFHYDTGSGENHPSFSPDGLSFVYSAQPENISDTELFIYFWQTDELLQVTDDDTYDQSPSWGWGW